MQGDKGILFRKTTYLSNSFHTITYGSVMDMSEFKRWISYIYAYNGEIKGKNVGFAKIEARDGKCRLNISIKGAYGCDTRGLDVGLFVRRSGRPVRFSAGRMRICAGAGEFGETTRRDNLFESGYALADCGGLWITGPGKDTLYLTSWEKDCLDIRDFLGDEAAARRQEEPPVYQKEMQSPEKEDKKAQEMQAPQESREPVQTAYVTGETSIRTREDYVERLQSDEDDSSVLDFIITVDTFNEGIDIPKVNQIIMLRPTQSSIIFIQQLGRGLRKNAEGKEYLVVIDFIGNYKKSFLIPVALSGDNTYDKDNLRKYITEGSSVIPGTSTIDFDPIAKELIYRNIDASDITRMDFLRKEYFALKSRLGRIPSIADFSREKAIDIQNFVDKSGSYYSFVKAVDKEYGRTLDADEEIVIRYISEKFSDGKRRAELTLLKDLLSNWHDGSYAAESSPYYIRQAIGKAYDSMLSNLDMTFLKLQDQRKYGNEPLVETRNGSPYPAKKLERMLRDPDFRMILDEVIEDGLRRNSERYNKQYKDTSFVLYEKYTYEDVCRLLNWEKNMNALNIGGYFYDRKTKTLPVFINYEKDDSAIQYQDRFLDDENLIALSKKPRKIGSPDYNHIYKTAEDDKDNRIFLFIRKNSEDERKEFYFLGEIEAVEDAIPVKVDGQDAFEIHYLLAMPVRRDIYDYITS